MNTSIKSMFVMLPLIGAFLGSWSQSAGQNDNQVPSLIENNVPPDECYSQISDDIVFFLPCTNDPGDYVRVALSFSPFERVVRGRFSFDDQVNGELSEVTVHNVNFPVAYYPTGTTHLGGNKVAISGVDPNTGLAKIEVWLLKLPTIFRAQSTTGQALYFLRPSSVESATSVFSPSSESNFGLIRAMWANRVLGDDHLLVLNYRKGGLYDLDLSSKVATLVLSDTGVVSGAQPVPELAQDWIGYLGPWRHTQEGDAYILTNDGVLAADGAAVSYLYLWDHNLDGIPETAETLSREGVVLRGLNGDDNWDGSWPE